MNSITKSIIMIILGMIFGIAACFAQAAQTQEHDTYIGYVISQIADIFTNPTEQSTNYEYSLIEYEEYQFDSDLLSDLSDLSEEVNNAPDREGAAPSR